MSHQPGFRVASVTAIAALLLAACGGGKTSPAKPLPVPDGFQVSDPEHWHFGYPTGWTTDESTGEKAEHVLNVRGTHVTSVGPVLRPGAVEGQLPGPGLCSGDPRLLGHPRGRAAIDRRRDVHRTRRQAGTAPRVHLPRQGKGWLRRAVALLQAELPAGDNTAITFTMTVPAGHEGECQAEQVMKTFTMKPAKS